MGNIRYLNQFGHDAPLSHVYSSTDVDSKHTPSIQKTLLDAVKRGSLEKVSCNSSYSISGDVCGVEISWVYYSGTSLLWTPWGPNKVSCIERCPHFRGKFLLRKHIWDIAKCP